MAFFFPRIVFQMRQHLLAPTPVSGSVSELVFDSFRFGDSYRISELYELVLMLKVFSTSFHDNIGWLEVFSVSEKILDIRHVLVGSTKVVQNKQQQQKIAFNVDFIFTNCMQVSPYNTAYTLCHHVLFSQTVGVTTQAGPWSSLPQKSFWTRGEFLTPSVPEQCKTPNNLSNRDQGVGVNNNWDTFLVELGEKQPGTETSFSVPECRIAIQNAVFSA